MAYPKEMQRPWRVPGRMGLAPDIGYRDRRVDEFCEEFRELPEEQQMYELVRYGSQQQFMRGWEYWRDRGVSVG